MHTLRTAVLSATCLPLSLTLATAGCGSESAAKSADAAMVDSVQSSPFTRIGEVFVTRADTGANLDSPAVWHLADGTTWVITTGKQSNKLHVFDGVTGAEIRTVGETGSSAGQFRRPNGVTATDSLLFVVERDNKRVQVLSLPSFTSLGTFGSDVLQKPYGVAIVPRPNDTYDVYITDDFDLPAEGPARAKAFGERVKQFRVTVQDGRISSSLLRTFGDTSLYGRLNVVESIYADPDNGKLLVADEDAEANDVKVYTLEGAFTGKTIGKGVFRYQAEGIALAKCGTQGYWVMTDQDRNDNRFYLFDRITYRYLGGFTARQTANTDGIVLTQHRVGSDSAGMLYALHDDGAVSAIRWSDIVAAAGISGDCKSGS